jgi:triacylglycerol esterase/lipase EstA (alpha/beta hydrolase family)
MLIEYKFQILDSRHFMTQNGLPLVLTRYAVLIVGLLIAVIQPVSAQEKKELDVDGATTTAMLMGEGEHAVILVHGTHYLRGEYFFHEYGANLGNGLAKAGFRVIAPYWSYESGRSFSGFGQVDAALKYALAVGAKKVSIVGMSFGGELIASFAKTRPDNTFDTIIELSSVNDQGHTQPNTKKLLVFLERDSSAKWQQKVFDTSVEPKQMIKIEGSGHAIRDLVGKKPDLLDSLVATLNLRSAATKQVQ